MTLTQRDLDHMIAQRPNLLRDAGFALLFKHAQATIAEAEEEPAIDVAALRAEVARLTAEREGAEAGESEVRAENEAIRAALFEGESHDVCGENVVVRARNLRAEVDRLRKPAPPPKAPAKPKAASKRVA